MGQRFNLWPQNVKRNPIFTRLQLCTTFCIVCFGSFCYLYHSYNVKFWVRIRVLLRRTRSSNVFYPAVSVSTAGKHGWGDFNAESLSGDESMEGGEELNPRLENSDWYVLCYLLHCNSFTDLRNKLLFGPDVVFVIVSFFFSFWKPWVRSYYRAADK